MMDLSLREEIDRLHAQICGGLADPKRILILYALTEDRTNVSELSGKLGLPQSTVSRHLKILRDRDMVAAERDGQSVYYRVADERIIQALDLLRAVLADVLESRATLATSYQRANDE
ncbi:MAG TPA: ArsR family transcriptional regulator [Chloroflexi bacterium]|nr:ArsR family transcriptional regulator [Chloroflexota bacterium]